MSAMQNNTYTNEHQNTKMTGTRGKIRQIGECINRIVHLESSPLPRYPVHSTAEIREFNSLLASTGADIGGGPYPSRDSVAFRGPEYVITGLVRHGKIIHPDTIRREQRRAAAYECYLQRRSSYAKRHSHKQFKREEGRWQSVRLQDHELMWWCNYVEQLEADQSEDEEDMKEQSCTLQRSETFTSVHSRRCRLAMNDEDDNGTGSSIEHLRHPAGSHHAYWTQPGEKFVLRVTNPDPVVDES